MESLLQNGHDFTCKITISQLKSVLVCVHYRHAEALFQKTLRVVQKEELALVKTMFEDFEAIMRQRELGYI